MTFRALALLALAAGAGLLAAGLTLIGVTPFAPAPDRHLREMKRRTATPGAVTPVSFGYFLQLPQFPTLARRSEIERRAVSLECCVQRLMLAPDGDVHLELTPEPWRPGRRDTAYATGEITPQWRAGKPAWRYESLLDVFRPDFGGSTRWDTGPRHVRVTGWLLYDFQFDRQPTAGELKNGAPRVAGWEIHPVTRIETWDPAQRTWSDVPR